MTETTTASLPSSDILHESMKEGVKEGETPPVPEEGACPSYTPPLGGDEGRRMKDVISSVDALGRARARVGDATAAQIWGLHVRARAVTQFIGETSAGKTVFLHNLGYHLAKGTPFLGITPPRAFRVLHLDFETYDDLLVEHLNAIGTAEGWDFLDLEHVQDKRGPELVKILESRVRDGHYDVVIVDPLLEAFPVANENDNAQAEVQMRALRLLARGTGAAVVLAHNAGLRTARNTASAKQRAATSKYFGRGATNRVDRADVSINFTAPTATERLLYVAKSRARNLGQSIRVRFAGEYGYEVVAESASPVEDGITNKMAADILRVAREEAGEKRNVVERKTFMDRLGIERTPTHQQRLDRALKRCVEKDKTLVRAEGGYSLVPALEPKTTLTEDDLKKMYTSPDVLEEVSA